MRQTGHFKLVMATDLGEGKLRIQTCHTPRKLTICRILLVRGIYIYADTKNTHNTLFQIDKEEKKRESKKQHRQG